MQNKKASCRLWLIEETSVVPTAVTNFQKLRMLDIVTYGIDAKFALTSGMTNDSESLTLGWSIEYKNESGKGIGRISSNFCSSLFKG